MDCFSYFLGDNWVSRNSAPSCRIPRHGADLGRCETSNSLPENEFHRFKFHFQNKIWLHTFTHSLNGCYYVLYNQYLTNFVTWTMQVMIYFFYDLIWFEELQIINWFGSYRPKSVQVWTSWVLLCSRAHGLESAASDSAGVGQKSAHMQVHISAYTNVQPAQSRSLATNCKNKTTYAKQIADSRWRAAQRRKHPAPRLKNAQPGSEARCAAWLPNAGTAGPVPVYCEDTGPSLQS